MTTLWRIESKIALESQWFKDYYSVRGFRCWECCTGQVQITPLLKNLNFILFSLSPVNKIPTFPSLGSCLQFDPPPLLLSHPAQQLWMVLPVQTALDRHGSLPKMNQCCYLCWGRKFEIWCLVFCFIYIVRNKIVSMLACRLLIYKIQ